MADENQFGGVDNQFIHLHDLMSLVTSTRPDASSCPSAISGSPQCWPLLGSCWGDSPGNGGRARARSLGPAASGPSSFDASAIARDRQWAFLGD